MNSDGPILVVDGDLAVRANLREQLARDGFPFIAEAGSVREAVLWLTTETTFPRALIVDAVLPDGEAHIICSNKRVKAGFTPVIVMGSYQNRPSANLITIAKPFRLWDLIACLKTQLQRSQSELTISDPTIRIGPHVFNLRERSLQNDIVGQQVRLTEKEAAILIFLYRQRGRFVPRVKLLEMIWGYHSNIITHTLETHVYRLRRKIEISNGPKRLLLTECGGYRLVLE